MIRFKRTYGCNGKPEGWLRSRDIAKFYVAHDRDCDGRFQPGYVVIAQDIADVKSVVSGTFEDEQDAFKEATRIAGNIAEHKRIAQYVGISGTLAGIVAAAWSFF